MSLWVTVSRSVNCSYGPRLVDSGCLGNLVSLRVPATTGGGPCGDTGD